MLASDNLCLNGWHEEQIIVQWVHCTVNTLGASGALIDAGLSSCSCSGELSSSGVIFWIGLESILQRLWQWPPGFSFCRYNMVFGEEIYDATLQRLHHYRLRLRRVEYTYRSIYSHWKRFVGFLALLCPPKNSNNSKEL